MYFEYALIFAFVDSFGNLNQLVEISQVWDNNDKYHNCNGATPADFSPRRFSYQALRWRQSEKMRRKNKSAHLHRTGTALLLSAFLLFGRQAAGEQWGAGTGPRLNITRDTTFEVSAGQKIWDPNNVWDRNGPRPEHGGRRDHDHDNGSGRIDV